MAPGSSQGSSWAFVVRDSWCKDADMDYLLRVAGFVSADAEVLEVVADCIMSAGKIVTQKGIKFHSGTGESRTRNVPFEHFAIATALAANPNVTFGTLNSLIEYYTRNAGLINEEGLQFLKDQSLRALEREAPEFPIGRESSKPRTMG